MSASPVVVVGARCAGAATAMLLARAGFPVVLLDRDAFPSDTLSTHWIVRPGIELLERWGLLDAVVASGCPPVDEVRLRLGSTTIEGAPVLSDGTAATTYAPRRTVLDRIMVDAAVAAGAELHTGITIRDVLRSDAGVTGVRGQDKHGRSIDFPADLVVGADGRNSTVARAVGSGYEVDRGPLAATIYGYWSGLPVRGAEVLVGAGLGSSRWPTNDGLTVVAVTLPRERVLAARSGFEPLYRQALSELPQLADELAGAELRENVAGAANLRNFYRTNHGAGWVLVGDAYHHKDPIGSRGISDAFADAAGVARAYQAAAARTVPIDRALARHAALRACASAAAFEFICRQAALTPMDVETEQLMQAVSASPQRSRELIGVFVGATRFEEFFAPANLDWIRAASESSAGAPA